MESLALNRDFWRDKKVLITGHTGFKGSWLTLWLQSLQASVYGFAQPASTTPNLFAKANIANNMNQIFGDIRDANSIHHYIETIKPDIIFHLAAVAIVRTSFREPMLAYHTNTIGTLNVLEACRLTGQTKAIICVTSDKCYAPTPRACHEDDALGGTDPYSTSKACAELIIQAYRQSYFLEQDIGLASVRAGNVIGGGDWGNDRLIPDIIRAKWHGLPLVIRYPQAIRPWQHVLDALYGYLLLAEKLYDKPNHYSSAWNFGPEESSHRSVEYILNYFMMPYDNVMTNINETEYLNVNSDKAKCKLGWSPRWPLEKALQTTATWYHNFYQNLCSRSITLANIHDYQG